MTVIKSIALLLVLAISAIATQECTISLLQERRSVWSSDAGTYSLYDVRIQNTGAANVAHVTLTYEGRFESSWEITAVGEHTLTLPDWRIQTNGIPSGEYHQFGYVIKGDAPAAIQVVGCDDVAPSVPTGVPTDAPVEQPTEDATDAPVVQPPADQATDAPVEQATDAPVEAATDAPVEQATDAPTDAPADIPTDAPTGAPTYAAPAAPTGAPTAAPTDAPSRTSRPSRRPSAAPTSRPVEPTAGPTDEPTRRPATAQPTERPADAISAPTSVPTSVPTSAPTSKATTKATTAPTSPSSGTGTNGRVCASGTWWKPAPLTTYQWQISGTLDTSINVQMYDIDLFGSSAATIKKLHDAGRVVVCYFSTQYENWRPDASSFTSAVIGNALDDWEGENYVDIRSTVVRNIMAARLDLAASKGCDGVEPDNVDGYQASTGFPLKAADQLDYNKFIANEAHKRGLSVGLKNDLSQAKALEPYFDWALNEECYSYSECEDLNVFIQAGKAVFNTEYAGSSSASKICPYMNGLKFTSLLKDLSLGAKINAQCCTYLSGGCAPVAPTCGSSSASLIADEPAATAAPALLTQEQQVSSAVPVFYSATLLLAAVLCGLIVA